ncbi:hypothetical protein F4818DRAFT_82857 [Hypoxylon cercidicola]|nr:hypothetical protein F4818DRAFT_82857 [Hypoxylon cercidicola]
MWDSFDNLDLIRGRDENTGVIYTSPIDTDNGSFIFPRTWPLDFRETSTINISWTTKYEVVNLYYYQKGKVATSLQLSTNQATEWYQWEVMSEETNLTEPFVFRIVNARGTSEEKLNGGFWSTSFYIVRNAVASTTSSLLPSSTLSESSSTASTTTSSTTTSSPTSTPSQGPLLVDVAQAPQDDNKGLSSGAIAGIVVATVVGVAALAVAYMLYRKRRARRSLAVPGTAPKPPLPSGMGYPMTQEIYTSPPELPSAPIFHELPNNNR